MILTLPNQNLQLWLRCLLRQDNFLLLNHDEYSYVAPNKPFHYILECTYLTKRKPLMLALFRFFLNTLVRNLWIKRKTFVSQWKLFICKISVLYILDNNIQNAIFYYSVHMNKIKFNTRTSIFLGNCCFNYWNEAHENNWFRKYIYQYILTNEGFFKN